MIRARIALAVGLALLAAAGARSQPFGKTGGLAVTPLPLTAVLIPTIDTPAIVADLKLTDAQVAALVAYRQEAWDKTYITVPSSEATGARGAAAAAALKKTLSPAQYKRATQLAAQRVLLGGFNRGGPGAAPFLLGNTTSFWLYPELADIVRLTDEQKKALNPPAGGFVSAITLTPEQQAAAREFMGPILATGWAVKSDPRIAAIPTEPPALALLGAKDVRADAGVTDEQAQAVAEIAARWSKHAADRRTALSPKDAAAAAATLTAETEKLLAATLTPAQATRLKQIARQTEPTRSTRAGGSHVEEFYATAEPAREFGITPEQTAALDGAWAAFRADAAKAFAAGSPVAVVEKQLADLAAARRAKAEAVLTPAQAAQVKAAFGAPFTGSTRDRAFGTKDAPAKGLETLRAASFGKYTTELTRLALDPALQAELKLTPEQIKKAEEATSELSSKSRTPLADVEGVAKSVAERSALVEAALGKLLTPTQGKRFREVMMQAREPDPARKGAIAMGALSYPGVAEAVNLTADQRKAALAGTPTAEVLTAPQKETLAKLMGEPYTAARTAPRFGPRTRPLVQELAVPGGPFEAALALTPEQTKGLTTAREAYQTATRGRLPGSFSPGSPFGSPPSALDNAATTFDKAVTALLTPAQARRLTEITRQSAAATNLHAALTTPDAAALALTPEQRSRLAALAAESTQLQRLLARHSGADTPDRSLAYRLRDTADERMFAVLTADQRAKWAELTGAPVAGLRKVIPGAFELGGGFGPLPGFSP